MILIFDVARLELTCCKQREYCPPLDTALFLAIAGEFDLEDDISLVKAREILDQLKVAAENDDATHFDSAGTGNSPDTGSLQQSLNDERLSTSGETKLTTDTTDTSSSMLEDGSWEASSSHIILDSGIDHLGPAEKEALLFSMFPEVRDFDISSTLKRLNWNFLAALDDILTHVYLKEEDIDGKKVVIPKSIDGFALPDNNQNGQKRKGKSKKRSKTGQDFLETHPLKERSPNPPRKWNSAKKECDFISQRVQIAEAIVTSCYHKSGGNLRQAILLLCEVDTSEIVDSQATKSIIQENTSELQKDFPHISAQTLNALIQLTHPSTSAAHELAKALVVNPFTKGNYGSSSLKIVPQYTPLILPLSPPSALATRTASLNLGVSINHTTASSMAQSYNQARFAALEKANVAYRKSRSTPLMAAAAGYYASVGRDAEATSRHYTSLAADGLAARQSTAGGIDLHGINVQDGVRIAKERVEAWWVNNQEERARTGKLQRGGGYRIITGVGAHSDGGRAKLLPAIKKMLTNEGWKTDLSESGVLTVTGKSKK